MVYEFLGLLVESYGTWLLLQRLVDASKDSDIPKNVPFAFAINNRNTENRCECGRCARGGSSGDSLCDNVLFCLISVLNRNTLVPSATRSMERGR
jgi:hypothetical protein